MARSSAAKATAPTMFFAPTNRLRESPTNPRRIFRAMDELEASVREVGVLQSLLVRTRPGTSDGELEVVAGERRRRAALAAGVTTVPVILRELTDDQVREAQLVENNGREDVHPLEEADAFRNYLEAGHDVTELAAKLGRSSTYVRARLQLLDLSDRGRAALETGMLMLSGALVLASATRKRQEEILDRLAVLEDGSRRWPPSPITRKEIAALVLEGSGNLARVGWVLDDATLVRTAGPCNLCPKRSSAQADLFGEEREDTCLDRECFDTKLAAHAERKLADAAARGLRVITGDEARAICGDDGYSVWSSPLVMLDEEHATYDETEENAAPTTRSLLFDVGAELPITLVQLESGAIVECVEKLAVADAIKETQPELAQDLAKQAKHAAAFAKPARAAGTSSSGGDSDGEEQKRKREAARWRVQLETRRRVVTALVAAVGDHGLDDDSTKQALLVMLIRTAWSEALGDVIKRRGWSEDKKVSREEIVIRESREIVGTDLDGLLVEIVAAQTLSRAGQYTGANPLAQREPLGTLLANYSIDVGHHEREAKKALTPKASKKKAAAKPAKRGANK